jgi:hypothetical protein
MSATGADPQAEQTRLRGENRTWGLIRRTLRLGRSIGSVFYLVSVGLVAGWIVAVFFGVGLFFLVPRSAKLEPGLSPTGGGFDGLSAQTPWLTQSTSRLDRLSSLPPPEPPQPMGDDAGNANPHQGPAEATIAHTADEPPPEALSVEVGPISAATGEAAPRPAPQSQLSAAPKPRRGASQSAHSHSPSRKPPERRPSNTRRAQPHAAVSAIEDVLQKHSGLLK